MEQRGTPCAPLLPGAEPVPGFRLVRRLGAGGFGEVWEAEGPGGFAVALKVVPLSGERSAAHLRGVDIARAVRHPNLLAGFGAWIDDERLILAMELADGSLWDRFMEARNDGLPGIPRDELLDALAEAARGVDYLNEPRHAPGGRGGVGIQHRDLKPQNILLVGGGVKVADFGAARWMEEAVTGHTGIQWTPAYAAPEFFLGATSRHSDQYGLAVTYCHLRTGRLPFSGEPGFVMAGHLMREPDLAPLAEAERPAVARALAKQPEDRWPSCRAFVEALRAAATAGPTTPALPAAPRMVARACLVWPDRAVGSLAEAAPAVTYATGDPGPADPADDSVWDDAPPSGFDTVDGPGAFEVAPEAAEWTAFRADPVRRRREGVALASFVVMGGLALWASGLLRAPSPPRRPAPRPVALAGGRPPAPAPTAGASSRRIALRPASAGPGDRLVREGAATTSRPVDAPRPAASAFGRTLARLVLPLIANPTLPRHLEAIAPAPAPATAPPEADEAEGLADAPRLDEFADPADPDPEADPDPAPADEPAPGPLAEDARRRADDHLARGALDEAEAGYAEALRLDPGLAAALVGRGEVAIRRGELDRAIAAFDEALRLRPDSAPALNDRGLAELGRGDVFRAIADLDAALRVAPGSAVIHYNRGVAYTRLGDPVESRAEFDEALRLDPGLAVARAAIARAPAQHVTLVRGAPRPSRAAPAWPSPPLPTGSGVVPSPQVARPAVGPPPAPEAAR